MPVKQRLAKQRAHRITPDAVELFRRAEAMRAAGGEYWDQREYLDAWRDLDSLLGLHPWECSPLEVNDGPPPPYATAPQGESWAKAQELRRELLSAQKRSRS